MGIENMKETLVKLNSIKMFDTKVMVSLAKYDKDHKRFNHNPDNLSRNVWRPKGGGQYNLKHPEDLRFGGQPPIEKHASAYDKSGPSYVQAGISYADLLKGKNENQDLGAKVVNVEGKGSLYPLHCIGRAIIGDTKEIMSIGKVRLALEEEDLIDVGLSFVGGVTFLLTFNDKHSAMACMNSHSVFLNKVFSKFNLWNGEEIPFKRVAMINILGVPFLIRDNSLFDRIGGLFGDVIQNSSFSWQDEDNSLGLVKILTNNMSRIEEAVVIKWNKKSIVAWVSELPGQCMSSLKCGFNLENSDSELVSESDSDEELVNGEGYEEGEIYPSNLADGGTQGVNQSPVQDMGDVLPTDDSVVPPEGMEKSLEGQGPLEFGVSLINNSDLGNKHVHGDVNEPTIGECNNDRVSEMVNNFIPCVGPNGSNPDVGSPKPDFVNGDHGPTPIINLGKRNRDDRSPPSIGSVQGPSQKLFSHLSGPGSDPLDLNTPWG
ncbi:hypothetical protein Hanom_Chr05g00411961 [Helianthus anomalus]